MLRRNLLVNNTWCKIRSRNAHETSKIARKIENDKKNDVSKIRNIGILAHIDAGKTTTTERMLYYAGSIGNMGEVHDGNTVTDYMEQERQRGITIASAAVTFSWKNHRLNLIDTPGHIDFTMGVEQTLGVLDGAIVVLDGSAGVEAQTCTVWRQADRYDIPRIVYVNKMDRQDSNFDMSIKSVETKLESLTLVTQIPIKNNGALVGLIDLLTLEKIIFEKNSQGKRFSREKLENNESMYDEALERRRSLTDKLSTIDDTLADEIIEQDSMDKISAQSLVESIRRCTVAKKGVPVLLGSSYKNIGVQPLMDGVVLYLPSPNENPQRNSYHRCFENNFSARAFKIIHDKQRGAVTFFRVYTGQLSKGQRMYNIERDKTEQGGRLYAAYADDYEEVDAITEGNIGALAGLKYTITGDLLTSNASAASKIEKLIDRNTNNDSHKRNAKKNMLLSGASIPDPVFFCSIEPPSMAYQTALDNALNELTREDPSLRVTQDEESGQTILSGMGELHIDIIKERIKSEYKIDADLGPLRIAYKETVKKELKDRLIAEHKIGTTNHMVDVTLSVLPNYQDKEMLQFDKTPDSASNIANIHPRFMNSIKKGVSTALTHGPKLGCPVTNVGVKLHWFQVGRGTSETIVAATVTRCIRKILEDSGIILLEPIMFLEIVTPEVYASGILADLGRRRAEIQEIGVRGQNRVICTHTPLAELLGYATVLRIISSGNATFTLEFIDYRSMGPLEEQQAIKSVTGF